VNVRARDSDDVSAELWDLGAEGIEERDATTLGGPRSGVTLVAYFPDEREAKAVARRLGKRFSAHVEYVVGDEWRDAWKERFKPTRVGPRLVIRPSWEAFRPLSDDVVVTIDPGRAFGSGIHETTRLVLREVDRRVRGGETVLDVGCGSGILAVAALRLGARRATAVDIDPDAVEVSRENAVLNRVSSRLSAATTPVERVRGAYDLVVANIEARVLLPSAEAIARRVAPGGWLILSGLLRGQEDEVAAAYARPQVRRGLRRVLTSAEGEWVALSLQRPKGKRP
jgi:ribosomal protein L11 methyltransferase